MDAKDWRNRGQEDYLKSVKLVRKKFKSTLPDVIATGDEYRRYNDHEHCDFCFQKIMENCGEKNCCTEGYCTEDSKIWVCDDCYNEFKNEFNWNVVTE